MTGLSLIGFGVVFMLVCGTTSGVLTLLVPVLARRGAAVERRAAMLAAVLPVTLGLAVVATLAIQSLIGVDHCNAHGHHAHLCLQHGVVWGDRVWAVAAIVAGGAVVSSRALIFAIDLLRGRNHVSRLRSIAGSDELVRIVRSDRVFCFVAGILRPRIYVSSAVRDALAPDEWDAMLAHERSHIVHRDLLHRLAIEVLLLFAAPLAGIAIRERLDAATERLRDADAAAQASPESVASALVTMARTAIRPTVGAIAAFTPSGDRVLTERVQSLLDAVPAGEPTARRVARVALATTTTLVMLAVVFAEPLHHALETLLG
jgi:hypothetical protein